MGRFSESALLGRGFAVVLVAVFVALGIASGLYFAIVAPWESGPALVLTAIVAMMPIFLTAGLVAKVERRNVRSWRVALEFGTAWGAPVGIATNAVAAGLLFGPRF